MPRNGTGTYLLPSGINPVSDGTVISASWANPTLTDIATAITQSLPRDGQAPMTGTLKLADGSVSSPGIAWNSDGATGLFRPATSTLGFTAGGVEQARFTSGNLLLGSTSNTGEKLQVTGAVKLTGAVNVTGTLSGSSTATFSSSVTAPTFIGALAGTSDRGLALTVQDTRAVAVTPSGSGPVARFDFKANTTDGLSDGGTYHATMTVQQYSDATGGGTRQLGFTDADNLWLRGSGTSQSGFGPWKLLLNSANYNNYAPTLTGSGASGTWTINVTGNAGTATTASTATALANFTIGGRDNTDINLRTTSGIYAIDSGASNQFASGGYNSVFVARNLDTGLQIGGGHANDNLYFRGWSSNGATFTPWRTVIHSGNISNQTVSKAAKLQLVSGDPGGTTFNWVGQGGQPPWVWGGSASDQMYVYNPSNFSVDNAAKLGSINSNNTLQKRHSNYNNGGPTLDSVTEPSFGFAYGGSGNNSGPFLHFGGLGAGAGNYPAQFSLNYGSALSFKIRTRNDDAGGIWNAWQEVYHSGNLAAASTTSTASTLVVRDGSGHVYFNYGFANYINSIDHGVNGDDGTVTGIMTKRGDNYMRATSAASVRAFLNEANTSHAWGAAQNFTSTQNTAFAGAVSSLRATSSGGAGAGFSFLRDGHYGLNMGLDSDNIFRIGGWSAPANLMQMDMAGNLTMAGNVAAYSDARLKKNWSQMPSDFVARWANVRAGTYDRIDTGETQVGLAAQDVQEIMPNATPTTADGFLSLNYGGAAAVATVELAKEVVTLRALVVKQAVLFDELSAKIAALSRGAA